MFSRIWWDPVTRLLGCLSDRDRERGNPNGSNQRNRTFGGRVRTKKKRKAKRRPIPQGFLDRFFENYAVCDPLGRPVPKAVVDYYAKELTAGDYPPDFDPAKFPKGFSNQLRDVKKKSLENIDISQLEEISPDKQWRVVRRGSSGSFGTIYILEWHPFGTMNPIYFALKDTLVEIFWGDYCAEGELTRRLNAIGCPNVIKVHDWVKMGDPPSEAECDWDKQYRFRILYDYHEFGDLHNLREHYAENHTALLYCAHGRPTSTRDPEWEEIVHKDVKPANILLGPSPMNDEIYPKLLLADFGLAYTIPNDEVRAYKKAFPQGTQDFAAPESRRTKDGGDIGPASDVYSLGIILDQIITSCTDTIYDDGELNHIKRKPATERDKYLPYTEFLYDLTYRCRHPFIPRRPHIFEVWEISRTKAMEWRNQVRENRQGAFARGSEFYYGRVIFERGVQERIFNSRDAQEEFLGGSCWEIINYDLIQEVKNEFKQEQEEVMQDGFEQMALY
ncbi:hypothetical protein FQN54_004299 [Arachnomyces sp. PD_36]|nr:hypothetical protein FQN54_004299 [Arachnomyces sp. PD_36]